MRYYQYSNTVTAVVSAKIPDELRKKTKMYHIKVSKVVREALEDEVRKLEEKNLSKDLDKIGRILRKNVSGNEIVKAIRSSRDDQTFREAY
jgi:antitoxin CcdA